MTISQKETMFILLTASSANDYVFNLNFQDQF